MVASSVRHPIVIGDKTYDVSPLSDEGREAMDEWVRAKFVERITPIIDALKNRQDREAALDRAFTRAFEITWMSEEGSKLIGTVEGVAKLLYEGIRPNHPDVTFDELKQQMFSAENVDKANAIFRELNIRRNKEAKPDPGKKPSRSPRKKST
jgi:hypothetical protein